MHILEGPKFLAPVKSPVRSPFPGLWPLALGLALPPALERVYGPASALKMDSSWPVLGLKFLIKERV
jgi:hypothetical protein